MAWILVWVVSQTPKKLHRKEVLKPNHQDQEEVVVVVVVVELNKVKHQPHPIKEW
jgi:hypothetical protein